MLRHALDRSVWLGWSVIIVLVMTAFLWDSAVQIVVERDRDEHKSRLQKPHADHAAKFPGYDQTKIGPASDRRK